MLSHLRCLPIMFCLLLLSAGRGQAQLCTGSLGDPVVKIDFGTGSGSSGYVPTNSYVYTGSACPNDGYYTITRSIADCWRGTWHTIAADHTGGGAFLLVNATYDPGDFFVGRVSGLCAGTTYEFAAWVMNVVKGGGIRPNITFRIETPAGTVLQEYNSGDIPVTSSAQWRQYGFFFTTTANTTDVVLRMTNNARGGIGNDLALDDITFRPCGPDVSGTIVGFGDSVGVCVEQPSAFTLTAAVSAGFVQPVYQWQVSQDRGRNWRNLSGASGLSYQRPSSGAGTYWYRMMVTDQANGGGVDCGVHSNILQVVVHPPPAVSAGPDRTSLSGTPVQLQGKVDTPFTSFYWSPAQYLDDPSLLTPTARIVQDQAYTLFATSAYGCKNQDEVLVRVADGIYVPNAFTPNNDGLNDHWRIPFLDPGLGATVRVFNRYGQVLYQVTADNVDWDGRFRGMEQPAGTYVYQISFPDGRPPMKGTLSLIR